MSEESLSLKTTSCDGERTRLPSQGTRASRPGFAESRETDAVRAAAPSLRSAGDRFARSIAATALVVRRRLLVPSPGGYWIQALPRTLLSSSGMPCIAGKGTAFLVTPQHLVTAAHVIDRRWVADSAFVFDFHAACLKQPDGNRPLRYEFAADSVASGASIVGPDRDVCGDDITVVELHRPVPRCGVAVAPLDTLAQNQPVKLVGCARLQPIAIIGTADETPARVLQFDARVIHSDIAALPGSSGSALLDADGHALGVQSRLHDDGSRCVATAIRLCVIRDLLRTLGADIGR